MCVFVCVCVCVYYKALINKYHNKTLKKGSPEIATNNIISHAGLAKQLQLVA